MKVVIIDPVSSVPYYDYCLYNALKATECDIEFLTCPFTADPYFNYTDVDYNSFFFPWTTRFKPKDNTKWYYKIYRSLRGLEYIKDIVKLLIFLKIKKPEIVHIQWMEIPRVDIQLVKILKKMGFKVVFTAHNILPHENGHKYSKIYKKIYSSVNKIIVHSQSDKITLSSCFEIDEKNIRVVPHGNFDIYILNKDLSKKEAREKLGLPKEDVKIVLFFGLIRPYKGLEILLDAWWQITRKDVNFNAHLVIAGKKLMSIDNIMAKLNEEGTLSKVTFHNCFIPFDEVQYYFRASDLVVLPYIKTYNSGVIQIAYSFGLPVVASRTGGLPEVVEDDASGFLVEPANSKELATIIVKALTDEKKLFEMGKYAKYLSDSKYSWKQIANQTTKLYRDIFQWGLF